jgi:hypothetical protein
MIVLVGTRECVPEKRGSIMKILPMQNSLSPLSEVQVSPAFISSEQLRRKQIVNGILLVIVIFQLVQLPGAMLMPGNLALGIVLLGLALCGVAVIFNQLGKITVVSLMLILVVDLGCGLMLLTSPMGLGVSDLAVLDLLIISELIAVSLLPAVSVFIVAVCNILFIFAILAFLPRTPELSMLLSSNMAYNAVMQPVILQIVVAVVTFIWVRSALLALARADRAEEIAQLQSREAELLRLEAERSHQLEQGSEHLLKVLVRAANGDITVRAVLTQDNMLWKVGNAVNLLLSRLRRAQLSESENEQLRQTNIRLTQKAYERNVAPQQTTAPQPNPSLKAQRLFNPSSNPGMRNV